MKKSAVQGNLTISVKPKAPLKKVLCGNSLISSCSSNNSLSIMSKHANVSRGVQGKHNMFHRGVK